MLCKNCGEKVDFRLIRITAEWDDAKQDWDRELFENSEEEIICNTCNSFNIEPKSM